MSDEKITVREACRLRTPLDGTDAQCLEHALTITERERDEALAHAEAAETRNELLTDYYECRMNPGERVSELEERLQAAEKVWCRLPVPMNPGHRPR